MAITRQLAEAILAEHRFRPIEGNVLLLGRQMVFMTPDEAQALVEGMGLSVRSNARIEYDRTSHGRERKFISDTSFFSLFSQATVQASDVSDYEGADFIFDLSAGVPAEVLGRFDFIYNGSVLDNVFDPATCIKHISRMLKPSGVVMHYEGVAHFGWAYLKFTPDWFFDYYALNDFADGQFYLCSYQHFHRSAWSVHQWDAFVKGDKDGRDLRLTNPMSFPNEVVVLAIAQRAHTSTNDKVPLQGVYRGPRHDVYETAFRRFEDSERRRAFAKSLRPRIEVKKASMGLGQRWRFLKQPPTRSVEAGHVHIGTLGRDNPAQDF